jgi:hypothetical protein
MPSKKGGGLVTGLWTGTAVFAANKSRTFTGFLTTFLGYSVVLMVGLFVVMWVLRALGVRGREGMTAEIQCQAGETPTNDCYGERGCMKASGNCYKLLTQQA